MNRAASHDIRLVQWHAIANNTDDNAFDDHRLLGEIDVNRLEVFVLRQQFNDGAVLLITFDSDFIVDSRNYDLPAANFRCAMYGYQVTIENTGILILMPCTRSR